MRSLALDTSNRKKNVFVKRWTKSFQTAKFFHMVTRPKKLLFLRYLCAGLHIWFSLQIVYVRTLSYTASIIQYAGLRDTVHCILNVTVWWESNLYIVYALL